ncbi:hypothetical protein QR680_012049 [Steinernema hermaphroditum]|uniref:MENTAL domain-containing protein n=1 Tax=Steinernema hermaphroditum TaxID=289476 RepID=A0AA39LZV4_9BILA|nr:hypothetical protein QR680_012049 [Steinernema hermaphroditum]
MDNPHTPLIYDEHAMSKDRRRFLVFSVFDSAIAVVLWFLCLVSRNDKVSLWEKFLLEVNILQPNFFELSGFDVVIAALIRTSAMLLLYGVIRISIWAPVLFTTSATTIYTGFKALLYFNSIGHSGFQQYLLILLPFTIAWVELFMMPCQVLAHERRAARDVDGYDVETGRTRYSRASGSRGGGRTSVAAVRNLMTTDDEFRSAMEYTSGESDHEGDEHRISAGGSGIVSKHAYIDAVTKAEVEGERLLSEVESWRFVNKADPVIRYHDQSRTYYVRAEFETTTRKLFEAAWSDNHQWNRQITKFNVILTIDLKTELVHTIKISSMYAVYKRTKTKMSTRERIFPLIRLFSLLIGENGVNLVRISPSQQEGFAVYEWLMNSDVKGGIPRRLIERTMASFLVGYVKALREFLETIETSVVTSPTAEPSASTETN